MFNLLRWPKSSRNLNETFSQSYETVKTKIQWKKSVVEMEMWSTGEGNGKPLQYACLENPINSVKRQDDRILKEELPRLVGANMLLEINEELTPQRMKRQHQSKNSIQLWM